MTLCKRMLAAVVACMMLTVGLEYSGWRIYATDIAEEATSDSVGDAAEEAGSESEGYPAEVAKTEEITYTYGALKYKILYEESGQPYISIVDCDAKVTSVEVPVAIDGILVTTIGEYAFAFCDDLDSVVLPYSITTIENDAFAGCNNIRSIDIPYSVTAIGDGAFRNCYQLRSMTIPKNVAHIGEKVFESCGIFEFVVSEENPNFESVDGVLYDENMQVLIAYPEEKSDEIYVVPDGVTTIGTAAFARSDYLLYVDIPDSVIRIEEDAFRSSDIASVVIPESVEYLGEYAFFCCDSLTTLTISHGIDEIGKSAFYGCDSLTNCTYHIPDGTTEFNGIPYGLDDIEGAVTEFVIPESVISFDRYAFSGTPWLEKKQQENPLVIVNGILVDASTASGDVVIPEGVIGMVNSVFSGGYSQPNERITSVVIPEGVTIIPYEAFYSCTKLTSVVIPNSVTRIAWHAFMDCTSLTDVTISDHLEYLGAGAFFNTPFLWHQPTDVFYVGKWTGGSSIYADKVEIAPGTVGIGEYSFNGCSFQELVIPEGVKYIGELSFGSCKSLKQIYIPSSVNALGDDIFLESGLTDIYYEGSEAEWDAILKVLYTRDGMTFDDIGKIWTLGVKPNMHFNASPSDMPEIAEPKPEPEPEYVKGDANGDGIVTEEDAALVEKFITLASQGFIVDFEINMGADVNEDGSIDLRDANLIREIITASSSVTTATTSTINETTTASTSTTALNTETENSSTTQNSISDIVLYGDTNLDGRVDIADAVLLNKAVAGAVKLSDQAFLNADCNTDNELSSNDAIILLKFLVFLVKSLPSAE